MKPYSSHNASSSNKYDVHTPFVMNSNIDTFISHSEFATESRHDQQVYDTLVINGSPKAIVSAGRIALDVACRKELTEEKKLLWIERSVNCYQKVIQNSSTGGMSNDSIQAQYHLSVLPGYSNILLNGTLPPSLIRDKMFYQLVMTGEMTLNRLNILSQASKAQESYEVGRKISDLSGIAGELALLLLHQRFSTNKLHNEEQIALPSRISEDNGGANRSKGSYIRRGWDISILQQFSDEEITLPYKVQAKTKQYEPTTETVYSDDIVVVNIKEDLALQKEKAHRLPNPFRILREIIVEYTEPNVRQVTYNLDQRTELFLDKIDN